MQGFSVGSCAKIATWLEDKILLLKFVDGTMTKIQKHEILDFKRNRYKTISCQILQRKAWAEFDDLQLQAPQRKSG